MEAAERFIDSVAASGEASTLSSVLPNNMSTMELTALIKQVVSLTPTCYNCQGSRLVILYGTYHEEFWRRMMNVTESGDVERRAVECNVIPASGTIVLLEDEMSMKVMQKLYPLYASAFPLFAERSSAMAEVGLAVALTQKGIGTISRHYRVDVAAVLDENADIPSSWKMKAQIAFGTSVTPGTKPEELPDSHCFMCLPK